MNLLISLRSEILKIKRTASTYICILIAAIVPLISFLEATDNSDADHLKALNWHLEQAQQIVNFIFLPLYIILVSTLLLQIEFRNNTWKQVLASPQKLINVFLAKFITLQILILFFFISYIIWLTVEALGVKILDPKVYANGVDWGRVLFLNWRTYLAVMGISAIQFCLSLRFKNFIASLAIGLCLWFMAPLMIFQFNWSIYDKYPYSFPILSVVKKYQNNVATYQWLSVGYAVLFLATGFLDFRRRKTM